MKETPTDERLARTVEHIADPVSETLRRLDLTLAAYTMDREDTANMELARTLLVSVGEALESIRERHGGAPTSPF